MIQTEGLDQDCSDFQNLRNDLLELSLTRDVAPAEDLPLALVADIENLISVFGDGCLGGASWDVGSGFEAGVVFQVPHLDGSFRSRG